MMNKNQYYFCKKMFHRMMWPALTAGISLACSDIIDAVALGNSMGAEGLAAIGIITPLYILFNVIGYGFSVGGSVLFNQLVADGRREEALRQFTVMLEVLLMSSMVIAVFGNLCMKPLLFILGVSPKDAGLYQMCMDYGRIMLAFTPVFLVNLLLYDYLKSDNGQILATISTVTGCILDVLLNIILVIHLGYGVKGSIWSTVIALCFSVMVMLLHLFSRKNILRWQFLIPSKEDVVQCLKAFRVGLSTSVKDLYQLVFELTANNLLLRLAPGNGALYVASFDVVLNVSYFTCCVGDAVAGAIQPLTATFYIEQNKDNLKYCLKQALIWGSGLTALITLLLVWKTSQVAEIFGMADPMAVHAIRVFCIGTVFDAIITIFAGFLQSIDDEKMAGRIISIRYLYLLLPMTVVFCLFRLSLFWFVVPVAAIISCIIVSLLAGKVLSGLAVREKAVFTYTLHNEKDMGPLIEKMMQFCEEQKAAIQQTNLVNMAVEEICTAIIHNAFTGAEDEYIQITVIRENEEEFVLHLRDSAVSYDPFSVNVSREDIMSDDYMDRVGILMIKKKAKQFDYRRCQGFNVLMITV